MMWDSDASTLASVAGADRQVVDEVFSQWPVSPLPRETPWATYKVLYSFSSSGQLEAL
jgi:hypothetical protein